jgi:mannitol/fructose-specific phosphotransferase system IIA component (Ntr-type)
MKKKLVESLSDQKMDLNEFLGPNPNVVELQTINRWDVIDELVDSLVAGQKIKPEHRDAIRASLRKREVSMSTGIGFGVGLPHASTEFVSELVAAVGRSRKGVEFDSLDGKPVTLVMLFLVPQGQFQKHLHTLANLAKLLQNDDFRAGLGRRFE